MTQKDVILSGSEIVKTYPQKTGDGALTVLDNVSIDIERGSVVSVIGASGSGKSTLLHVLGGLDRPDSGKVSWNDKDIYHMDDRAWPISATPSWVLYFSFTTCFPNSQPSRM